MPEGEVALRGAEEFADRRGDARHLRLLEAALRDPGGAQAHAGGVGGGGIAGNGVAVGNDACDVEQAGGGIAHQRRAIGAFEALAVNEHHVAVGAAVGHADALGFQGDRQRAGVGDGLVLQGLELLRLRQAHGCGDASDGVHVRSALQAGEDGAVEFPGEQGFVGEDDAAAGAIQRFVGGEGDDVGDAHRAGESAGCYHAGDVCDVGHQVGACFVGDGAEGFPINGERIRSVAGDDQLGVIFQRELADGVVIQALGFLVHAVVNDVVGFAGVGDLATVAEVSPDVQRQREHGIAGIEQGHLYRGVGGRAGERLDVHEELFRFDAVGSENFGGATARERFQDVGVFHALVVARVAVAAVASQLHLVIQKALLGQGAGALVGIALGVEMGEGRGGCLMHGER
ncbi:MAG: hypothetical protein BWY25_03114 [Chloroflexi bacterium ADurb.Bin222]|nr:MAG: hypothetical protein BWY25_03114 [Chloroflexi bacterium ADurb.Bin222]